VPDSAPEVLNWLTFLLAALTGVLGWATWRMARSTAQLVELQAEPDLSIDVVNFDFASEIEPANPGLPQQGLRPKFTIGNPSLVRVTYELQQCLVRIGDEAKPMQRIDNAVGVVHPKASRDYFYTFIGWPQPIRPGFAFTIEIAAAFWAVPSVRHTLTCTIECTLESYDPLPDGRFAGRTRWIFLKGPLYS
jgi:hypothetical protein